jgi:transcriptional regulator with XRE-family HTH domain
MTEQEFFQGIGKRIREFRKDAKLTQKQVADVAQINQGDLATFETKGERIKSADIIRRIVEATGHSMDELFPKPEPEEEKKTRLTLRFQSQRNLLSA